MFGYQLDEILDPGRLHHDAKADPTYMGAEWNSLYKKQVAAAQAGPNANMTNGWNSVIESANDPNNQRLLTGSRDYTNRILSGEFLDPAKNLALAKDLQRGYEGIGGWDATAEASGRYGSGAWAEGRGREMADLKANLYGQGLDRMERASLAAPNIYKAQSLPGAMIGAVGNEQDAYGWNALTREGQALAGYTNKTAPTYSSNHAMDSLGGVLSVVGAIFGMPGKESGKTEKKTTDPKISQASYYGNNNGYSVNGEGFYDYTY